MENVLEEADLILVPMNLGEMHWALGIINLKEHCFEMYDSMSDGTTSHIERLQRWLIDEYPVFIFIAGYYVF